MSNIKGMGADIGNKITDFISKIISFMLNTILSVIYPLFKKIDMKYGVVMNILYLVRILFAIFIIIIIVWSGASGGDGTSTALYHVYSILKSISVILILMAGLFVVIFAVKREVSTSLTDKLPTEISVLYSFLYLLPYMYDLIAMVILLGILKAYYIRGCGNKNPNVYNFVDIIIYGPLALIMSSILLTIITRVIRVPEKLRGSVASLSGPVLAVSVALLMVYFGLQFIEGMVTNNLAYWMNLYDGTVSSENCYANEQSDEADNGFEKAKNIIISVILGILVLIIFIIQLIPFFGLNKVNETTRSAIKKIIDGVLDKLNRATMFSK
jgi:hypothetical protein